ncbi:MAG: hypothetical protein PVSMB4_06220 [Ktedonobacterales bacterium]
MTDEPHGAPENATAALVREHFADHLLDVTEYRGETTLLLRPGAIAQVCRALRDAPELHYNFLADITAVDWPEREPRFDVVYHLLSLETRAVVRLKVRVGATDEESPEVPTVTTVWPTANWYEREIFDLFGIRFAGHPNLQRILMRADWVGHPLRKDYPLTGVILPEPHWGGQVPFDQPLPPGTGQQTLRTPGGTAERADPGTEDDPSGRTGGNLNVRRHT